MTNTVGCPLAISALFAVHLIYDWEEKGGMGSQESRLGHHVEVVQT
jgi:hypothetical protein